MKLNLPQIEIDKINALLEKKNIAVYSPDAFTSYYFTYREILKDEDMFTQLILIPQEVQQKLAEELKVKGKEMGYHFVTMVRDGNLQNSIANGKVLYMYFFAKNKYHAIIPDSIIKDKDQSEVDVNVAIIPD